MYTKTSAPSTAELVPKKKDMHVQCCGGLVSEALHFKLKMFTWQHICVSLNLDTRVLNVIYDELVSKDTHICSDYFAVQRVYVKVCLCVCVCTDEFSNYRNTTETWRCPTQNWALGSNLRYVPEDESWWVRSCTRCRETSSCWRL